MSFTEKYRAGGKKFKLADFPAGDKSGLPDSKEARKLATEALSAELDQLQDILYAQAKHRFLVVLQGMDTSGKDGTIRTVFRAADPLGMRVQAFKAPSEAELARDYLWRVHMVVPQSGEIVIFNRSHYEDVLVTGARLDRRSRAGAPHPPNQRFRAYADRNRHHHRENFPQYFQRSAARAPARAP